MNSFEFIVWLTSRMLTISLSISGFTAFTLIDVILFHFEHFEPHGNMIHRIWLHGSISPFLLKYGRSCRRNRHVIQKMQLQKQTAVTAYFSSKQLLFFAIARYCVSKWESILMTTDWWPYSVTLWGWSFLWLHFTRLAFTCLHRIICPSPDRFAQYPANTEHLYNIYTMLGQR